MVIVKITGGLGNQMFHYAFGRALALRHGASLKLDLSAFSRTRDRAYGLAVFCIHDEVASQAELRQFDGAFKIGRSRWRDRLSQPFKKRGTLLRLPERQFHFNRNALTIPDGADVYVYGGWQSERYFADFADTIRRDFTFRYEPFGRNAELTEFMRSVNAVSLHVRRGDYVSDGRYVGVNGSLNLDYYRRAIEYVAGRVPNPHFFVFSDDPDWVRQNLDVAATSVFIDHNNNPEGAHEDMRLMSICRHHIIANSTFSWWGAWLAANPDKIVVGPRQWFVGRHANTRDVLAHSWVSM